MILLKDPLKLRFFALIGALTCSFAQAQMTPSAPQQFLVYSSTTAGTGSTGGGADCNEAVYDEGKPGDGGSGGTGAAYSNSNSTSINSVTGGSPYNTGFVVQSTGGTGGTGGYGSTCYGGRGGGTGGTGGAITINNGSSSRSLGGRNFSVRQ